MDTTAKSSLILDKKIFFKLVIGFIFFTIAGTLSHEVGHLFVSKLFGFKGGNIHYASTNYGHSPATDSLHYYRKLFRNELSSNIDFPERDIIKKLEVPSGFRYSSIKWGGPVQTMLTGTIGLIALFMIKRKKRTYSLPLSLNHWFWVFITLFWLRQVANCFMMFLLLIIKGRYGNGDESNLSEYYGLPSWTLNVITGVLGTFVLHYVVFKFISYKYRFTFIISGITGGIAGYVLWFKLLGPFILP